MVFAVYERAVIIALGLALTSEVEVSWTWFWTWAWAWATAGGILNILNDERWVVVALTLAASVLIEP